VFVFATQYSIDIDLVSEYPCILPIICGLVHKLWQLFLPVCGNTCNGI
jgi:hypothetical protein